MIVFTNGSNMEFTAGYEKRVGAAADLTPAPRCIWKRTPIM